ncbi:MAG: alanine racemase [Verrucomicrobiae bacterium]|nr:alanine racemase [Verrucomicrobiae bacterium]
MLLKDELRCWAEIDVKALRHNFRFIQNYIGRRVGIVPVIKANAYGHGLEHAALALSSEKVALFGVTDWREALLLRALRKSKSGFDTILLSPCLETDVPEVVRHQFIPVISTHREVKWFEKSVSKQKLAKPFPVHVKIDTGMGRVGAWHEEALVLLRQVVRSPHLRLAGIATHFASSDEDATFTNQQWQWFQRCLDQFCKEHPRSDLKIHAANSAAILKHPKTHADWVRPGLLLYGVSPVKGFQSNLKPVLQWKARVTLTKEIQTGRTLSYGATYRAKKKQRIAIVSAGYADGYPRSLSNRGHVMIQGKRCAILGRVTMDQMIVDTSSMQNVRIGEEVVLLGAGISAEKLAALTGTISYEIFCGIGCRVPRIRVN